VINIVAKNFVFSRDRFTDLIHELFCIKKKNFLQTRVKFVRIFKNVLVLLNRDQYSTVPSKTPTFWERQQISADIRWRNRICRWPAREYACAMATQAENILSEEEILPFFI
jgi:hypothetical protein